MSRWLGVILVGVAVLSALGQTAPSKYQPGTIMAVTAHQSPGQPDNVTQYDVSVKVGSTTYVVLYTPLNGANVVTYALGDELLVLVGSNTLAFNTPSGKVEAPILRHETLPAQNLNSSKATAPDFSVSLALTEAQQAEIRPLLEEEVRQVDQLCANTELSRADKLGQYEDIVQQSDQEIKPMLSSSQLHKLRDLRKQQKQDLKKMIADQKKK